MDKIISKEDLLKTFSDKDARLAKCYCKAIELNKEIKNKSQIARLLNVKKNTLSQWLLKKTTPNAIKSIKELEKFKLLPLIENNSSEEFTLFVIIFSFI